MTLAEPLPRAPADHAPGLELAFAEPPREGAYAIDRIEGELPRDLRGTYYLNGPARFARGGLGYRHWLDGDGMVSALRIEEGRLSFVNRFVRSAKWQAEEAAGRPLFRAFGTAFDGDRLLRGVGLESPVNVSVCRFAGRLLALGEQGLPWELDPVTLETRGRVTFGGRLNEVSPFSAHPALDRATGEMFNFGVSYSRRRPRLYLYRFDPAGELIYRRRTTLDLPLSLHDFGLSPRFAVFHLGPYTLDAAALVDGGSTLFDALRWRPDHGSRLVLKFRDTGRLAAVVPIETGYCLHLIDCFEREGRVVVDLLELDRPIYDQYAVPDLFPGTRRARPVRYVVDPWGNRVVRRFALDYDRLCDFPVVDPRREGEDYGDFWLLGISASGRPGRKFFDRLVRLDWRGGRDRYRAPAGAYLGGEPAVAPGAGGAAYLLCHQFDATRRASAILVFDAFDLRRGPLARVPLRSPIQLGFHACFVPADDGA